MPLEDSIGLREALRSNSGARRTGPRPAPLGSLATRPFARVQGLGTNPIAERHVAIEKFFGKRSGSWARFAAGQETFELGQSPGAIELENAGGGPTLVGALFYAKVDVGARRDSRLMGDAQDLSLAGETGEAIGNRIEHHAPHPAIHFIEDEHFRSPSTAERGAEREHHPRQLTSGGSSAERVPALAGIGGKEETHGLRSLITDRLEARIARLEQGIGVERPDIAARMRGIRSPVRLELDLERASGKTQRLELLPHRMSQPLGSPGARRREVGCRGLENLQGRRHLVPLLVLAPPFETGEVRSRGARRFPRRLEAPMTPHQPLESGEPVLDRFESAWIAIELVQPMIGGAGHVFEQLPGFEKLLPDRNERRVETLEVTDHPLDDPDPLQGGAVLFGEDAPQGPQDLYDLIMVAQDFALGAELLDLVRLRIERLDFGRHLLETLGIASDPLSLGADRCQLITRGAKQRTRRTHPRRLRLEPRRLVEEARVLGLVEENLMLVLAMEIDERRPELAQGRESHRLVVDEGPASSVVTDDPTHAEFLTRGDGDPRLFEARTQAESGRLLERSLDNRGLGALSNELGARPTAAQSGERGDQERFAGTRLAGQNAQSTPQRETRPLDQSKITDGEPEKHGPS